MKLTALKTHSADRTTRRGEPHFEDYDEPNEVRAKQRIDSGLCEAFDAKKQGARKKAKKSEHDEHVEAMTDLHARQREQLAARQEREMETLTSGEDRPRPAVEASAAASAQVAPDNKNLGTAPETK